MKKQNKPDKKERSEAKVIVLSVEELEPVIAPRLSANHNEMLVSDQVELVAEELEEVIAPKLAANHNETLVSDTSV